MTQREIAPDTDLSAGLVTFQDQFREQVPTASENNPICTLPLLAGENIGRGFIVPTVASCVDLVVHCGRDRGGARHVQEIVAVGARVEADRIESSTLFSRSDGELRISPTAIFDLPKLTEEARAQLLRMGVPG